MAGLVMDNGSESSKVGFVGDDVPRVVLRSVVGHPKTKEQRDFYVGDEAQKKRDLLDLMNPIERGLIRHWDDMEKLWHHSIYSELKADPAKQRVLITEAPLNPQADREKTTQIMFEKFNVPALTLTSQPCLSLYSTGRLSGVVMESGAGLTHVAPINQGYPVAQAGLSLDLAGRDLTDHMMKLLTERGLSSSVDWDMAQDIKEKLSYLPLTFQTEMMREASDVEKNYELPDGKTITIGKERFCCPEALLQPTLIGKQCPGLHTALVDCLMKCDPGIHKDLWKNLVISGGSSLIHGLCERLQKDITALSPASKAKILAPEHRRFSAWLGGTILCGLSSDERWISKQDFQEHGPSIINIKCPN